MVDVNNVAVDLKSLQIETNDKPSLSSIQSGGIEIEIFLWN